MNNYPKISVVMVNYNGLKYLERTVHPILELDYPDYEFIIVDNGSTDGSLEFIKKLGRVNLIQSPRIREKNFACNYAINEAKGDYILLLDNDIILREVRLLDSLLKMYSLMDKIGQIGLCLVNEGEIKSSYYGMYFGLRGVVTLPRILLEKLSIYNHRQIGFASGAGTFIKKDIWQKVGGYDELFSFGGDDSDLGMKLSLAGYKNYLYAKSYHIHIGMEERRDNKIYSYKFRKSMTAILGTFLKNLTMLNVYKYLPVLIIYIFVKSLKQSLCRLSLLPAGSFFGGFYDFIIRIPSIIEKRRIIQKTRKVKEDTFLKIKFCK